jgi:hypothetical protein
MIEMTQKEFKQFQKIEHKRKVEADSEGFTVPGLAKTILSMEKRIAKLEKQAKAQDARINKLWAWKIEKGEK